MFKIDREIIEKIQEVDKILKEKYLYSYNNNDEIRQKIQHHLQPIRQMERLETKTLSNWLKERARTLGKKKQN